MTQKQPQVSLLKRDKETKRISKGITVRFPKPPLKKIRFEKTKKIKTLSKEVPVFVVKVVKRGKIINITPIPLTLKDAKDFLAYQVNSPLMRTAYFELVGTAKNVGRIPSLMSGYYSRNRRKLRPLRPYSRIRVGKKRASKRALSSDFIEKKQHDLDKAMEKRQARDQARKEKEIALLKEKAREKAKKRFAKRQSERVGTRKKRVVTKKLRQKKNRKITKRSSS